MRHILFGSFDRRRNRKLGRLRTWPKVTQWETDRARIWNSNYSILCITPAHLNSCIHSWFLLLAVTLCFPPPGQNFWGKKLKAQENQKVFRCTFYSLPLLSPSFFLLKSKRQKNLAPIPSCRFFWVSQMLWSLESWDSCLPPLFIKAAMAGSSGRQAAGAVGGRAE